MNKIIYLLQHNNNNNNSIDMESIKKNLLCMLWLFSYTMTHPFFIHQIESMIKSDREPIVYKKK